MITQNAQTLKQLSHNHTRANPNTAIKIMPQETYIRPMVIRKKIHSYYNHVTTHKKLHPLIHTKPNTAIKIMSQETASSQCSDIIRKSYKPCKLACEDPSD